jgi:hypothetical protein
VPYEIPHCSARGGQGGDAEVSIDPAAHAYGEYNEAASILAAMTSDADMTQHHQPSAPAHYMRGAQAHRPPGPGPGPPPHTLGHGELPEVVVILDLQVLGLHGKGWGQGAAMSTAATDQHGEADTQGGTTITSKEMPKTSTLNRCGKYRQH